MSSNNCVVRALSTMRLALGYAEDVPEPFRNDSSGCKTDTWVLENAARWFPGRAVFVWCCEGGAEEASNREAFAGTTVPADFDYDAHLMAFSICREDDEWHHMVIGTPGWFNAKGPSIIMAVPLARA